MPPPGRSGKAAEGAAVAAEDVDDTLSEVTNTWNGPVLARRHAGAGGANTDAATGTESLAAEEKSTAGTNAAGSAIFCKLPRASSQGFASETAGVET